MHHEDAGGRRDVEIGRGRFIVIDKRVVEVEIEQNHSPQILF